MIIGCCWRLPKTRKHLVQTYNTGTWYKWKSSVYDTLEKCNQIAMQHAQTGKEGKTA